MVRTGWSSIFFKASILLNSIYSIHPFLQNHPGAKYLLRQGIELIPSPKQQRRPLPSPLSLSLFCAWKVPIEEFIRLITWLPLEKVKNTTFQSEIHSPAFQLIKQLTNLGWFYLHKGAVSQKSMAFFYKWWCFWRVRIFANLHQSYDFTNCRRYYLKPIR